MGAHPPAEVWPCEPDGSHAAEDGDGRDPLLEMIAADPRLHLDLSYGPERGRLHAWVAAARELASADPGRYAAAWPDAPTGEAPGSWAKVGVLALRLERGQPLFQPGDAGEDFRIGFDVDTAANGDHFRNGLAVQGEGGVEHIAEQRPPRQKRRRTVLERVRAARQGAKAAEAARKRQRRKAA